MSIRGPVTSFGEKIIRSHESESGNYLPAAGRLLVNLCTLPMVPLGIVGATVGALVATMVKAEVAKGARAGSLVGAGLGAVLVVPLLGLAATAVAQGIKKSMSTNPQGESDFPTKLNNIWKNSCIILNHIFPASAESAPVSAAVEMSAASVKTMDRILSLRLNTLSSIAEKSSGGGKKLFAALTTSIESGSAVDKREKLLRFLDFVAANPNSLGPEEIEYVTRVKTEVSVMVDGKMPEMATSSEFKTMNDFLKSLGIENWGFSAGLLPGSTVDGQDSAEQSGHVQGQLDFGQAGHVQINAQGQLEKFSGSGLAAETRLLEAGANRTTVDSYPYFRTRFSPADVGLSGGESIRERTEMTGNSSETPSVVPYRILNPRFDASSISIRGDQYVALHYPSEGRMGEFFKSLAETSVFVSLNEEEEKSSKRIFSSPFPQKKGDIVTHSEDPYDKENPVSIEMMEDKRIISLSDLDGVPHAGLPTDGLMYLEISKYKVTIGDQEQIKTRVQVRNWGDRTAPDRKAMIHLHHVLKELREKENIDVIGAHCHSGIGRTGTFIASEHLMRRVDEHLLSKNVDLSNPEACREALKDLTINPMEVWAEMMLQRTSLQGREQVLSIYDTVISYIQVTYLKGILPSQPIFSLSLPDWYEVKAVNQELIHPVADGMAEKIFTWFTDETERNDLDMGAVLNMQSDEVRALSQSPHPTILKTVNDFFEMDKFPWHLGKECKQEDVDEICRAYNIEPRDEKGQPKDPALLQREIHSALVGLQKRLFTLDPTVWPQFLGYLALTGVTMREFIRTVKDAPDVNKQITPLQLLVSGNIAELSKAYPGFKDFKMGDHLIAICKKPDIAHKDEDD